MPKNRKTYVERLDALDSPVFGLDKSRVKRLMRQLAKEMHNHGIATELHCSIEGGYGERWKRALKEIVG